MWRAALLIPWLLASAHAASPLRDPGTCGSPTCEGNNKFKYSLETEYLYKYSANVTTFFYGTNRNASNLLIDSEVSVRFITPCEGYLQLQKTTLVETTILDGEPYKGPTASANSAKFAEALQEHPLRFSFQDGDIDELCPKAGELSWVLNFKRGVLSSFQNTMERFDVEHSASERDVHGDCETEYALTKAKETSLVLRKTKHMDTCTNRFKQHSVFQTTPYQFPSKYNSIPLMNSKAECTVIVDHNVYSDIECSESHLFQPFSNHERGAKTEVRFRMVLLEEANSTVPLPDQVDYRTTLIFDHRQTPKPATSEIKTSRDLLKKLCQMSSDGLQEGFSRAFKKLVQTLRVLTSPALVQLYNRASSICSSGKKHMKSALPHLGTNAGLTVMRDMILKDELPEQEVKDWLFAIALTPTPDAATLEAVAPLLKYKKITVEAFLALSAVVHSFRRAQPNAEKLPIVLEIVYHLQQIAQTECQKKTENDELDSDKLVSALKALGNIGIDTPVLNQTLQICVENDLLPMEARLAAIEVHRRLPCHFDRGYLHSLLEDVQVDSELRIASYMEVMRCPSYKLIKMVKHMLKTEEVNQVGSFIMSHLESLKKSSIPSRVEIQGLLTDANLRSKFSKDARKFSQHFEKSVYHEGYNIGGNVEGGLVFSSKSYIPRSASLNFTIDMFGESINLLEVSGRIEGFEKYVEGLFGPTGDYSEKNVKEKVDQVKQYLRIKRDGKTALKDQIKNKGSSIFNARKNPKMTFGMRIFGNELQYKNYDGEESVKSFFDQINPKTRFRNLLNENEINFEKSTMFMDSMYVVPTGVGLPINLNAVGTAAVDFKTSGSFRAPKFLDTGELDVEGVIKPSVVVEVTGSMSVDAYFTKTNIEVKSNVYSAAAMQCQVKVRGKSLVSATFSLPKEKTEIFSAKSELFLRRDGANELQEGVTEGRTQEKVCLWPPLEQMFGLRLCLDYQYPNTSVAQLNSSSPVPPLPFTGPVRFNANILKSDPTVQKYLVEFIWDAKQDQTLFSLTFDTPGSSKPRKFSTRLEINRENKTSIQLVLQNSQTTWEAQGQYLNTPKDRHVKFGLSMNGTQQLVAEIGLRREEAKNGHIYYPKIYLAQNKTDIAMLGGSVRREEKKGITQWQVNLRMAVTTLSTNVTGYIKKTDSSMAANVTFNYQVRNAKPERARVEFDLKQKSSKGMEQKQGEIKTESSAYPYFNIQGYAKYLKIQSSVDLKIDLKGSQEDENKWSAGLIFMRQLSLEVQKMTTSFEILKPSKKIDFRVAFDGYRKLDVELNATASLRYAQDKEMLANVYRKRHKMYQEGVVKIKLPTFHPMTINGTVYDRAHGEQEIDVGVTWFNGAQYTVVGSYHDKRLNLRSSNHHLKLIVGSQAEGFEEIVINAKFQQDSTGLRTEVQASQNKNVYSLGVKYKTPSEYNYEVVLDARFKTQVYIVSLIADLKEEKQITIDLHLDKMRDVSINFVGLNEFSKKKMDFEIKWDVNRDPEQKISLGLYFENPVSKNYSVAASLSYPGRTVKLAFKGALKGVNFDAFGRCEWAPDQFMEVSSNFQRQVHSSGQHLVFKSQLLTPFDNWKRTTFNTEMSYGTRQFLLGGDLHWQNDQNMIYNISGHYVHNDDYIYCIYNGTIVSTIEGIPSITSYLIHNQTDSTVKTDVRLQRGPERLLLMKSEWNILKDDQVTNLTGKVDMVSPFQGYKNGKLVGKIVVKGESEIHGVADLKLEDKNFRIDLDGHFTSFVENMLILNATTPEPKTFAFLGRLGYSEKDRHFVAQFSKPNRSLGAEVLLQMESLTEFNVILDLATPFQILRQLSFKGHASKDQVNLRASFNEFNVGLSGLWHYQSITHFEYSFNIYTPLPGYEKNGVVAKFVKEEEELDVEASITIADAKVGVTLRGTTKEPQTETEVDLDEPKVEPVDFPKEYEAEDEEEEEEVERLFWKVNVQVDTIVYPPVVGDLLFTRLDSLFNTEIKISLPQGLVVLNDTLNLINMFDVKNDVSLTSPWPWLSQLNHHLYLYIGGEEDTYRLTTLLKYEHNSHWIDTGFDLGYQRQTNIEAKSDKRTVLLHIHSPIEVLRLLHLNGSLDIAGGGYNVALDGAAGNSTAAVEIFLKADENGLLDFSSNVDVKSIYFDLPKFKISSVRVLQRDDSKMKTLTFNVQVDGNVPIEFDVQVEWFFEKDKEYTVAVTVTSPYEKLKVLSVTGSLARQMKDTKPLIDNYRVSVSYNNETNINSNGKVNYQAKNIEISVDSTFEHLKNLKIIGDYGNSEASGKREFAVQVHYNGKAYLFDGWYQQGETAKSFKFFSKFISGPKNANELVMNLHIELRETENGFVAETKINYNKDSIEVKTTFNSKNETDRIDSDLNIEMTSTMSAYEHLEVSGKIVRFFEGTTSVVLDMVTPIKDFEQIHMDGSYLLSKARGSVSGSVQSPQTKGHLKTKWVWLLPEHVGLHFDGMIDSPKLKRHYATETFFQQNSTSHTYLGGLHFSENFQDWHIGGNLTASIAEYLDAVLTFVTPDPNIEVYKISGKLLYPFDLTKYHMGVTYDIQNVNQEYGIDIKGRYNRNEMFSEVGVKTRAAETTKNYRNYVLIKTSKAMYDINYKLKTPLFEEETVVINAIYKDKPFTSIRSEIFYPENQFATGLDFDYQSKWNMNGTLNTTTPIKNLDRAGVTLQAVTLTEEWKHYLMLFWNNNTALLNSNAFMDTSRPETQINGTLVIEVPITSRHVGLANYNYFMEDDSTRIGHTKVIYNQKSVLEARLRSNAIVRRGYDSKNINLEVENQYTPIGVIYRQLKQFEDVYPSQLPKTELQRVEVFKLRQAESFNLTGQLEVLTTEFGKEVKITAINPNRTVSLSTDYKLQDRVLHHNSRIQVEPDVWLSYNMAITNLTEDELMARKRIEFNLQYPERNVTFKGNYNHSQATLSSDLALFWEKDEEHKTIGAGIDWKKISVKPMQQVTAIYLRHPSLEKDVTLTVDLYRDDKKFYDVKANLEYTEDEEQRLFVFSELLDESHNKTRAYKLVVGAQHPVTSLELKAEGNVKYDGNIFQTNNYVRYKRSYLPLSTGEAHAKLFLSDRSLELERINQVERQYFKGRYDIEHPLYTARFDSIPGAEQNATGFFFLDVQEYETALTVNTSEEENHKDLRMIGKIPDARNALFRVWRDYDGVIIPDVSYYMKLNHSRLITSKFIWRAELPDQLTRGANEFTNSLWEKSYSYVENWRTYIRTETEDAVTDIWSDAELTVTEAVNDINDIKDIQEDIIKMYTYLNSSYYENHFYVRDIVDLAVLLIDELSLRRHLETVPALVIELWTVLGDTGVSWRKSIVWAIDAFKDVCNKIIDLINSLRKGEPNVHLVTMLDGLRENYDKLIKDLRISFTKRLEDMRRRFTETLNTYLKSLQQMLTPMFLKFIHLAETAFVKAGDEISGFFYEKKKEIVESQHYQKLAIMAQDVQAIYKDISKNDAITNIKKYSKQAFEFLREKYVTVVPFGKEFHDLAVEIWNEIKELGKLSSVNFIMQKLDEVYEKLEWVYQKFDVGGKLNDLVLFFHLKIYEISQTALDAENNNREAKTKFIFEPEKGIVELEQKLPISWHSFNERPNFEEIPEYKFLTNLQGYFTPNNRTMLYYYGLANKYIEPSNWLPPFKAQAMLVGAQHIITFDHRVIQFRGSCAYLLAHDFASHKFSVIVEYSGTQEQMEQPTLVVLLEKDAIRINLAEDSIQINDKYNMRLPIMTSEDTYIFQQGDIVYIKSTSGFNVECNFHFDICTLQLSGWYFGKTAGLFGTMDNEPVTDLLSTNGTVLTSTTDFASTWQLETAKCADGPEQVQLQVKTPDAKIIGKCDVIFDVRESAMADCFAVIDPTPYKEMCLTSRIYKEAEVCISAKAYVEECVMANVIVRMPDECIQCDLGEKVLMHGSLASLETHEEQWSTDVVLIVEAKECNRNFSHAKHVEKFLNILSVELREANITKNRLAVVTFGGEGVFDEPRTLMTNKEFSEIFATKLLENVPIGNGSTDIMGAITYAAKMKFRPTASKTFILLPCSNCSGTNNLLDYPFTNHMLAENDITLHIMMDDDFPVNKSKARKLLFGVDARTAYTKKDFKELKGDADLFRQVTLPKDSLGLCLPLALESNGTIFSTKKLETDKERGSKNFATVLAKRVAWTARPSECLHCECTMDGNGASLATCSPCLYPSPLEGDFDEDTVLKAFQPDYSKIRKLFEEQEMLLANASHKFFE